MKATYRLLAAFFFLNGCSTSDEQIAAPPQTLEAPTNLTITRAGVTKVLLAWTDNSNSEESFAVERKQNSGSFLPHAFVTQNATSLTDTLGVFADSTYSYRVRALQYAKSSSYSNTVTIQLTLPFP